MRCEMKKTMTIAVISLALVLSFCPLDVSACEEGSARDASYWKKMYSEPRLFLFPLEPLSFSSPTGPSHAINEDGIKALARRDYGEAEMKFSEAIRITPDSAPLQHNMALVSYKKLDLERAAELWKRATLLDSGNPRYLYHLAFALSSNGEIEEAISRYQDLLTKLHKQPEIYNNLGQLFEFKGDFLRAEKNFSRAVALKPDYLPALNNLGNLYGRSGRLKEAEHILKKVAGLRPADADNYLNLGALYSEMGKKLKAVKHFREAIRLRPDYPELHLRLARVYREMGRVREANEEEVFAYTLSCKLRPDME